MKSFIVLGLGKFGMSMAKALFDMGSEVLAVDEDINIVQDFSRQVTHTMQANATDEEFLRSVDIGDFDAAVVAVGSNMQVGIMATVLLKELGAKYILVKAQDEFEEKVLYKVGADKVILPEKDMGLKAAHALMSDNVLDTIEISPDYSIVTIEVPDSWVGKTIGSLSVRIKYNVNIVAIKGADDAIVVPGADTRLETGMVLTVMGANANLKKLNNIR
jgi:trk system potassium uptake protein TrkA